VIFSGYIKYKMSDDSGDEGFFNENFDEESLDIEKTDNTAFYSFLNVPHNASTEEITAAYKKRALMYHPDRHQDPDKRAKAELLFTKLNHIHGILTDPHKRAIYDTLGEKGLKEQEWELVQRVKTPQEIREEYEAIRRAREERRLQQLTNPSLTCSMTVNATDIFDRYLYEPEYDDYIDSGWPELEISKLSINHSIQAPLTPRDTCTLNGNVFTSNGTGSGNVSCNVRRVTSEKGWVSGELGVGNGLSCVTKFYRKLVDGFFLNMSGSLQFNRRGLLPGIEASLGSQLDRHTVGYLRYNTNWRVFENQDEFLLQESDSGMAVILTRSNEHHQTTFNIQFGIPNTYLILAHTRIFQKPRRTLRGALKLGTFGAILEYGCTEKITSHSTLGVTMSVGSTGVICKLKLTRATQTFLLPIHLSDEIMLQPVFYGTVVPLLAWFTVKKLILNPLEESRKQEAKRKEKEATKEKIAAAKKEAESSLVLMEERYKRIKAEEESKDGLIIERCLFGMLATSEEDLKSDIEVGDEVIDITRQVQCCVENSRLVLWEGSKSGLPGVWDPCPGDPDKWILVKYFFKGASHQLLCHEVDAIKLPKTSHKLPSIEKPS